MIDWSELTFLIYAIARMSGLILFNPILGRRNLPGIFRSGFVLALSIFAVAALPGQTVHIPAGVLELLINILLELALGFLLGMVVNFFFYVPQLTGTIIDTQMGMTMNQIYDAASQANMSVSGVILNLLMTLLFFVANGHHTMIRIFLTSGQLVPFGSAVLTTEAVNAALALFVQCSVLGIKLCMPIMVAELITQVGMGVLMKVIPQINVFAINVELKVIVGLGLMLLMIAPFSEFLLETESLMLDSLSEVLRLAG